MEETNQIIVTYIHHSCYTVELENHFIIFDYYKGELGDIPYNKKVIYVATHGHADHYSAQILKDHHMRDNIYLLSSDIKDLERENNVIYLEKQGTSMDELKKLYSSDNVYFLDPDQKLQLEDNISIVTFGSTDLGISILMDIEDITIFHSGDLYYWCWKSFSKEEQAKEKADFLREIEKIRDYEIDIAFFPVDPRLEENAFLGGEIFLTQVEPQVFFPAHFWEDFELTRKFKDTFKNSYSEIQAIHHRNESISIDVHLV